MLKKSPLIAAAAYSLYAVLAQAQEAPSAETPATSVSVTEKKSDETKPLGRGAVDKPGSKPTPKPVLLAAAQPPASTTEPMSTPLPKKPSFFQRVFGGRKRGASATPNPAASPTPTPTPTPHKSARKPAATPAPEPESGKPGATPKPDAPKVAPAGDTGEKVPSTPSPKKTATSKTAGAEPKKPVNEPPADADPDVKERFRFDQAKAKAVEDSQVKNLKAKADNAATEEDSRKALRAYNKALFEKIRKIDSGVSDRADRLEAAILKRLSE
jgi:hypothetical protein